MIKPILFNTDMVRAILADRKTVTRRVVKPQPAEGPALKMCRDDVWRLEWWDVNEFHSTKVPYRPGDILYVRETWRIVDYLEGLSLKFEYAADGKIGDFIDFTNDHLKKFLKYLNRKGWCPNIFMPREAARIFLRVTDVRVERLQDSFFKYGNTIFYLQREGIDIGEHCRECIDTYGSPICNDRESECGILDEVRGGFSDLWDSTIKPANRALYGWEANPWVWVIEFERCEKPKED